MVLNCAEIESIILYTKLGGNNNNGDNNLEENNYSLIDINEFDPIQVIQQINLIPVVQPNNTDNNLNDENLVPSNDNLIEIDIPYLMLHDQGEE